MTEDTICAIATAPGGALGIIRVSGPESLSIVDKVFVPVHGARIPERKPSSLVFGAIRTSTGEVLDEAVVSVYHAPHSYTGEDSVEISVHGSSYIMQQVIQLLVRNGCRTARSGEYTQRAFLNGKMDLSQAEAVADLIASRSAATHRLAMNQMRGGFSKELRALRDRLLHFTSLVELELDFSDHEELEFANRDELHQLADEIEHVISRLTDSFSTGNALKNGVPVAIIGETNAGKSTLLNALLHEDKAIVSDIQGTTRDAIEDTISVEGITFRFIDTAGIRHTEDTIENLGIERTFQKMDQASMILWMIDASSPQEKFREITEKILSHCDGKKLLILFNKSDLITEAKAQELLQWMDAQKQHQDRKDWQHLFISAKQNLSLDELEHWLVKSAALPEVSQDDIIVTNARHYEALLHALDAIRRVQQGLDNELPGDLMAQDLRECIFYLQDIVGEVSSQQVLNNIFEHFCIGK